MTTILVDTHVLHWWTAEPKRLSRAASRAIASADEVAVADITWSELAQLEARARILVQTSVGSWLAALAAVVRTVPIPPAVAEVAARLPATFPGDPGEPGDPADRLIYATAVEHGWRLVTKDARMHGHPVPTPVTTW
ncbi:MAG: type II toxin-antitoxin system VapC family toxin [Acidimicrobiales bacterium]